MEFAYRAQKESGELVKGVMEASDRFHLARLVKDQGAILVYAEPAGKERPLTRLNHLLARPSQKELMLFISNLGALLAAGLTLSRALSVLSRQAQRAAFREVVDGVARAISRGESLHQALAHYPKIFPPVVVAMVAAGEESGTLADTFKLSGEQLAKSYDLRRKIRGAMIYPAIIIAVIIIIAGLMMAFLVPTLAATFNELGVDLPLSTRIIIGLSDFLVTSWSLVLGGGLILAVAGLFIIRRPWGQKVFHRLLLVIPGLSGLVIKTNAGLIMRTIASLISAGVSMVETLRITSGVTRNYFYRQALLSTGEEIEKGLALSAAFKTREKLFPPLVGELAEVGEETGEFSNMMVRGAVFYESEVDQAVKNISTIIEPVLMIIVGLAVGFFALAMIGPMYSLSDVL